MRRLLRLFCSLLLALIHGPVVLASGADDEPQLQLERKLRDHVKGLVSDLEGAGARGAGIVHNDVDLAERLHRRCVSALQVGSIGHVALQGDDTSCGGRRNGLGRLVERLASACDDCDVGAGAGKT